MVIDNNEPVFPGNNDPIDLQKSEEKRDIAMQKKISMARKSRSLLTQIDRLDKEIASDARKLQRKEEKLASLVAKL